MKRIWYVGRDLLGSDKFFEWCLKRKPRQKEHGCDKLFGPFATMKDAKLYARAGAEMVFINCPAK